MPWLVVWYSFATVLFVLLGACIGCGSVALSGDTLITLSTPMICLLVGIILFFVVFEGYIGFHRSFSPATVRRCFLAGHLVSSNGCSSLPIFLTLILAPLFACGFFYAPGRRLAVSWVLLPSICILIVLVRMLSTPYHEVKIISILLWFLHIFMMIDQLYMYPLLSMLQ